MEGSEANPVLASRDGPLLTLTLNRPHRLNAVSRSLYERLVAELEGAEGDRDTRCVILTGNGRAFCAGADLKAHRERPQPPEERRRYTETAQRANRLIQTIGTPVVAAVNGHAIGAGLELALSADFAIVADDARLRLPEVALGTFVGGGAVYTLAERVGVLKAREIILLGDFFSGAQAAAMGVVNRAVPAAEVLDEATSLAHRLARRAPIPLAAAKKLIGPAAALSREEALERERAALEEIFGTEDWREGLAAFHEKRPPRYRGE
ncbi:MAG: enoyl-CoA hydratase-related protein [Gemmatimonadota bacterium]|nr:enoyl-CoA hydratase-related protein [Gemmatimonadota bacterium]MDE2983847.1 enoyl-CoA hydratase-related protein [Gemmatimonadota bacterium]